MLEEEKRLAEEEMEKSIARERKLYTVEGAIYGHEYSLYSVSEISRITNYDFLEKMSQHIFQSHQPQSQEEYNDVNERYKAVKARMNDVLLNDMD